MDMLKKLDFLMTRYDLNKHTLAEKSGIPYMTITNFYKSGYKNAKMTTLFRLSDFFNVPVDYLILDQYDYPEDYYLALGGYTMENNERHLLHLYRSLNPRGQAAVLSYVEVVSGNPAMTSPPSTAKKAT